MASKRVAVVTGGNKGIGFGIVRALCKGFDGDVFLTARDEGRGKVAVSELNKESLHPKFHQLDILDLNSIQRLADFLRSTYGGLDILVNNAGIAYKNSSTAPFGEQAEVTMATNFTATLNISKALFPLLRPHARVANVSSFVSQRSITKCSPELQAKLKDPNLTMEQLEKLMQQFVDAAKKGTHQKEGWPDSAYGTSKIGVTLMSFIQQKQLKNDSREDLIVNACCPGWVSTDMSSHSGPKTIDQGADTPSYLALLPPNVEKPCGDFVSDRTIQKWG